MQKFIRSLNRVWKNGFTKSMRMMHIFLPLTLFFTIIITCSGLFFFSYGLINHLIKDFENKLNIVVYLDRRLPQNLIDQVTTDIQTNKDVLQIEFVSSNQALADFKEKHKNNQLTMEALAEAGDNPFGSSVVVFAKDTSKYEELAKTFATLNEKYTSSTLKPVESISYENNKVAIQKFSKMLKRGEVIFAILLILISVILLFIVYIALRFATQGDRDEIKVMKLVGASNLLMVGPTSVMGIFSGFLGALLSLFILYFLARELTPYTLSFANFNVLIWYIYNIQYLIIFTLTFGISIGFFGSVMAIRRYL